MATAHSTEIRSPVIVERAASTSMCLVCGRCGNQPFLDILLKCAHCGFVTADLDQPVDVKSLYDGDYFTGQEYLDYAADEASFRRTFRQRLERILRIQSGGRLLEIGSAYGFFLDLAREHFATVGFEVNREAVSHAQRRLGLDVRTDDFLDTGVNDVGGPVDVTVMWDVIEHLERPDAFLAKAAALSRPGALLCLTTGDIGSLVARIRGRRWRMIHPPTHLHYFDRRSIRSLLSKFGYEIIDLRTEGVARGLRQMLYAILALRLGKPGWYDACKRLVPPSWSVTLNLFDIMHVTARLRD